MAGSQRFLLKMGKIGGRRLEKVNAAEKFGVDFFQKSVRSEVKKNGKILKIECTKRGRVCKNRAFFHIFFTADGR